MGPVRAGEGHARSGRPTVPPRASPTPALPPGLPWLPGHGPWREGRVHCTYQRAGEKWKIEETRNAVSASLV